ncbi:Zinc finger C3H1-type domain containing protein [Cryptosporidium felis]|nr:Zinc finger C3H1-type domain containing protein [Cryptosporidium felis]
MACPRLLSDNDLCRFRTKPCRRSKQMGCDFGITRCQYSHNIYWPRRCPFYLSNESTIRYIPVLCPDIIIKDDESSISHCNRGGGCPFAHSHEEINYHPLMYKTKICEEFQRGDCNTYYCHLIHGLAEKRESRIYILPYAQNVQVPSYPGVVIASKINKGLLMNGNFNFQRQINNENLCNNPKKSPNLRRNNIENMLSEKWSERIFSQTNGSGDDFWRVHENDELDSDKLMSNVNTEKSISKTNSPNQNPSNHERMKNDGILNVFRAFVLDDDILPSHDSYRQVGTSHPSNNKIFSLKTNEEKERLIGNFEKKPNFDLNRPDAINNENSNKSNFFE